ncbi:hypothetical protein HPB52_011798 [Rhipicephalus sanguineus]|uniref:N-alpha-acetyltransferase 60 n=1 Tax=Rhipicephalus sanguineus TaxID=34632 RepID=A0A9D4PIP6_RHISA|nr:hypothetical protein HPB52_011798 [Rhipicephalus sanguineus]
MNGHYPPVSSTRDGKEEREPELTAVSVRKRCEHNCRWMSLRRGDKVCTIQEETWHSATMDAFSQHSSRGEGKREKCKRTAGSSASLVMLSTTDITPVAPCCWTAAREFRQLHRQTLDAEEIKPWRTSTVLVPIRGVRDHRPLLGSSLKDEVLKIMPVQKQTRADSARASRRSSPSATSTATSASASSAPRKWRPPSEVPSSRQAVRHPSASGILGKQDRQATHRALQGDWQVRQCSGAPNPGPPWNGIVSAPVPKKLLHMAGIEDCYTSARDPPPLWATSDVRICQALAISAQLLHPQPCLMIRKQPVAFRCSRELWGTACMLGAVPLASDSNVQLRFLAPDDATEVRRLCTDWFPIEYPDSWYHDITSNPRFFALAAMYGGRIIGLIVAESKAQSLCNREAGLLAANFPPAAQVAYILTLGVVRECRRNGIATLLLDSLLAHLSQQQPQSGACKAVYLHVLASNTCAIQFYERRRFRPHAFLPLYYSVRGTPRDDTHTCCTSMHCLDCIARTDYIKHWSQKVSRLEVCALPKQLLRMVGKLFSRLFSRVFVSHK